MRRRGVLRVLAAWTLIAVAIAAVIALQGIASLDAGQQACFLNYPAVPCPGNDDPAIARITFAFFGVPVVWLLGTSLVGVAWVRQRRRTGSPS